MLVSALMVLFAMKEATHMPDQITREQRHDLRSETLSRLTEVCEDSALALQNEEYDIVRELRPEYGALMDAMDRLGWEEGSDPLVRVVGAPDREALVFLAGVSPTAAALLATGIARDVS